MSIVPTVSECFIVLSITLVYFCSCARDIFYKDLILCLQVSIFYECFSEEELHTESEERNSIREMVQYYNRRFSGQHSSVSLSLPLNKIFQGR